MVEIKYADTCACMYCIHYSRCEKRMLTDEDQFNDAVYRKEEKGKEQINIFVNGCDFKLRLRQVIRGIYSYQTYSIVPIVFSFASGMVDISIWLKHAMLKPWRDRK